MEKTFIAWHEVWCSQTLTQVWTGYLGRVTFTIPVGRISSDFPQNLFFHRWSAQEYKQWFFENIRLISFSNALPTLEDNNSCLKSHLARRRSSLSPHGRQRWADGGTPGKIWRRVLTLKRKLSSIKWQQDWAINLCSGYSWSLRIPQWMWDIQDTPEWDII